MGLFDFFRAKGEPVAADTVIKRMSAHAGDFEGVKRDAEDHPVDVYECGRLDVTGRRDKSSLYRCRETTSALRNKIKKNQVVVYYLSPQEFDLEFSWRNGGGVKMTARLDTAMTSSISDWLLRNVANNGDCLTAEELSKKLDREFSSDAPPDWLKVSTREDVAEPEKPPETGPTSVPETLSVEDLKQGVVVFDHYRIEKELGTGGQGKVFLATDTDTVVDAHRRVVLKVLRCESCGDELAMKDFIREANTLSNLRDERIAACHWCKVLGNVPILAMEYIEGESLDEYLAKQNDGKIGEQETRELLLPIAEALDYAHAKGIFHRDVKPPNIIVRKVPKRIGNKLIRTCLLDFGIASRDQGGGVMTSFWSVRGTLQYMSPGQKIGKPASADMDVYSLAVTAYECLTGTMPYPDGWFPEVKVPPLDSDTPFAKAVMRGMALLPKDRPQTCVELIDPPKPVAPPVTPKPVTPPVTPPPDDLVALSKSFIVYRQLLTQSAQKCEKSDPNLASWLRSEQAMLRDLTKDLSRANVDELEKFFVEVKNRRGGISAEDFFAATDRIVELRAGLPQKGGRIKKAIKDSISN